MTKKATFGGGCFWCIEAVFQDVRGIENVVSGYAGGHVENPSYESVCSETTGHAEVVQVEYDQTEITYEDILRIFFAVHNPETKNREGPDVGTQYRSIVLYHDKDQKDSAKKVIDELEGDSYQNIVTEVKELSNFYKAEEKHQNFYQKNPNYPYCQMHIPPKLSKLEDKYGELRR